MTTRKVQVTYTARYIVTEQCWFGHAEPSFILDQFLS